MLQFLNAYVKHDAPAKAFLGRTSAENGVPKHIMEIRFSPKSFAEIMRSAARTGEESAWKAFQSFAADPMHRYMTGEEKTINRLGYALPSGKGPVVSRRAVQIEHKGLSRFRECMGQPWRWLRGDERYPRCAYGICAVCRVES